MSTADHQEGESDLEPKLRDEVESTEKAYNAAVLDVRTDALGI